MHAELERLFLQARDVEAAVWAGRLTTNQALDKLRSYRAMDATRVEWVVFPAHGRLTVHKIAASGAMVPASAVEFVEHPRLAMAVWAKMARVPRAMSSVSIGAGVGLLVFCLAMLQFVPRPSAGASAATVHVMTPPIAAVVCEGRCSSGARAVFLVDARIGAEATALTYCRMALDGKLGILAAANAGRGMITCHLAPCPAGTSLPSEGGRTECSVSR